MTKKKPTVSTDDFVTSVTTEQAAEDLNVSVRRVVAMIKQKCPRCGGAEAGCSRCFGTGRILPAKSIGSGTRVLWLIDPRYREIEDLRNRRVGKPKSQSDLKKKIKSAEPI